MICKSLDPDKITRKYTGGQPFWLVEWDSTRFRQIRHLVDWYQSIVRMCKGFGEVHETLRHGKSY